MVSEVEIRERLAEVEQKIATIQSMIETEERRKYRLWDERSELYRQLAASTQDAPTEVE